MALKLLIMMATLSQAAPADIHGSWKAEGGTTVAIEDCRPGGADTSHTVCGHIVALGRPLDASGAPPRDKANPDPALRSRTLVGIPFLTGFKPSGEGAWSGGRIYDPDSGRTYDSKLELRPDGGLDVAGCVLMFCKSQVWRRVQ